MLAGAQPGCYVRQQMNAYRDGSKDQACGAQVPSEASTQAQYRQEFAFGRARLCLALRG